MRLSAVVFLLGSFCLSSVASEGTLSLTSERLFDHGDIRLVDSHARNFPRRPLQLKLKASILVSFCLCMLINFSVRERVVHSELRLKP